MPKFMILSLPRSRSAWLSRYLTSGSRLCGHDLLVECGSILDFETKFEEFDGTVETGAIWGWRLIRALMPQVRLIVVQRPLQQVFDSFTKKGIRVDVGYILQMAVELDLLAKQPGVSLFHYAELSDEHAVAKLYELALGQPHNPVWWRMMKDQNIQIDLPERLARVCENQARIAALKAEVMLAQASLAPMAGLN